MKRNVWIPKMTKGRLCRLLSRQNLTNDEKEDLLDYKYFLIYEKLSAFEKGLMDVVSVNQAEEFCDARGVIFVPKNMFWITNISHLTSGFKSEYFV